MKYEQMIFVAALSILFGGCATSQSEYRDPGEPMHHGTNFTAYDCQVCVTKAVDALLAYPGLGDKLKQQFPDRKAVLVIDTIRNQTLQLGLPVSAIADSIRSQLVACGKFDIINKEYKKELQESVIEDMDDPTLDPGQMPKLQTQRAADYVLKGKLSEVSSSNGKTRESHYSFTLELVNRRTGLVDASCERQLLKAVERASVGW